MNIEESRNRIGKIGIVAVIRAANRKDVHQAVSAIFAGGISVIEITMTIPNATSVIRDVVREYGDKILVGAGTVLNYEQASECLDAGAEFLVSPGLCLSVLKLACTRGKLGIPGAMTPTEIICALGEGARLIKIFPCDNLGGPKYIKAIKGPFPQIDFLPTGGISVSNAADYFAAGSFALGIGSELVDLKTLRGGGCLEISAVARKLILIASRGH